MSGKHITQQQVRLYMNGRKQGQTQVQSGAKAGMSERTGQRIDSGQVSAQENKERHWRTRKDPFEEVWDSEVVARLEKQPALDATTLFEDLQDHHQGKFGNGKKRTFQRRVKAWKALHGPEEALWRLGGAPREHRTDSLSAAYKNLMADEQADLTERYEVLCAHYGMKPTRNNRGIGHENGAVESPHGHLKRRIEQALLLRGSADFASLDAYRVWLDGIVRRFNRRCHEALEVERAQLNALPPRRTTDFTEQVVAVTTSSTIEVKRVLYTVPARLIGERLRLHIFDERIEGYVGSVRALTLPRVYAVSHERRARRIDYRHVIASLARKPQAFRYSQLRDELLPNATYRQIWTRIDAHLEPRAACKRIVGILALAARADCEQALGAYLLQRLAAGHIPTVHALEQRFDPQAGEAASQALSISESLQHPLAVYDALLPSQRMEVH
jgi:hypothetical protein